METAVHLGERHHKPGLQSNPVARVHKYIGIVGIYWEEVLQKGGMVNGKESDRSYSLCEEESAYKEK